MSIFSTKSRFTGFSGVDVESMVQAIMKAESVRYDKLKANRQVLQWKQAAYQDVGDKFKTFQSTYLNYMKPETNMRSSIMYNAFKLTSKLNGLDTSKVTATTTGTTEAGTYRVEVNKLASKNTYSSSTSLSSNLVAGDINFDNIQAGDTIKVALDNGSYKTIEFTAADIAAFSTGTEAQKSQALAQVLNTKLEIFGTETGPGNVQVPKVTAQIQNGKLTITPTIGHTVNVASGTTRESFVEGTKTSGFSDGYNGTFTVKIGDVEKEISIRTTSSDNISSIVSKLNNALSQEDISELRFKVVGNSTDGYKIKAYANNSNKEITVESGILTSIGGFDAEFTLDRTSTLGDIGFKSGTSSKVDLKKSLKDVFPGLTSTDVGQVIINGKTIDYDANKSVNEFIAAVNNANAGVEMSYDSLNNKLILKSSKEGIENTIKFGADGTQTVLDNIFGKLGLSETTQAEDAEIEINGQRINRSTNNFEIYGLKLQLNEKTVPGNPVIINTERDNTKAMESITKFIDEYNSLISGLNEQYSNTRSKKSLYNFYEPLTDDQKANMTEKEIENWENEAKKGLLYRDSVIGDLTKTLRKMMNEPVTLANGTKISLYDVGIATTSDYKQPGKLEINIEKLKKALEERPSDVAALFTKTSEIRSSDRLRYNERLIDEGIAERLNDIVNYAISPATGKISTKAGIKGTTVKNDIGDELLKFDRSLNDMFKALQAKENSYYAKFSRMEQAINAANSQMAALQNFSMY